MKNDLILNPKLLLDYDFKIDARGYRPQQVDGLLDDVITDYETFERKEKEYKKRIEDLNKRIFNLEQQLRDANENMQIYKSSSDKEVSNLDLIRRVSNLEKIIYGKNE